MTNDKLMRTILIPTDFSKDSENAARYAVDFFGLNVRYVVLHAYGESISKSRGSSVVVESVKETTERQLKKLIEQLKEYAGSLKIEAIADPGSDVAVISQVSKELDVSCIVMGTKGLSALEQVFIGSTTYDTIKTVDVPVIAVPEKARYEELNKIVFAADYRNIKPRVLLEPLLEIIEESDAELMILNIMKTDENIEVDQAVEALKLKNFFQDVNHQFYGMEGDDIAEGINEFIQRHQADLMVVLARKESFFHRLLDPSVTRKLTMHTEIPLLALQDKG